MHMIDLTNENIKDLLTKYASVLELIPETSHRPLVAYAIEIGVEHLNKTHNVIPIDWKVWSIFLIKHLYKKLQTEQDITNLIDDFIRYYNKEYADYINDLAFPADEYEKNREFVYRYLITKK
jgi:hypothetical protein